MYWEEDNTDEVKKIEDKIIDVSFRVDCNKISADIEFICFPRNLIKKMEGLFKNLQISVDKIICSNYATLFLNNKPDESICEIGYNLNKVFNKQYILIIPKKVEKTGFFEKLFHFFK